MPLPPQVVTVGGDGQATAVEQVAVQQQARGRGDPVAGHQLLGRPLVSQGPGGLQVVHDRRDAVARELLADDGVAQGVLVGQREGHDGVGAPGEHGVGHRPGQDVGGQPLPAAGEVLGGAGAVGVEQPGLNACRLQEGGDRRQIRGGLLDLDGS